MRHLAIFAALSWECSPILRHLRQVHGAKIGGFVAWNAELTGLRVTVVKTGIGLERAEAATKALLGEHTVDAILSSGCAGALAAHVGVGDLVVADSLRFADGTSLAVPEDERRRAIAAADRAGVRTHVGPMLTSAVMLATPEEKRAAGAAGAIAVEMESAAIARVAAERRVPFGAVRSILDASDTPVKNSGRFVDPASGAVRPIALAAHLLRHPGAITGLLEMRKMMEASATSLDRFFRHFLVS